MKKNKLKIITITLLIVLLTMVSFLGVYVQDKNTMKNAVKDYEYSTEIGNSRNIILNLSEENEEENKNIDNYKLAKKVIEGRLADINKNINQENGTSSDVEKLKVTTEDYEVNLDENTGNITVKLPENDNTEYIASILTESGTFEIVDEQTDEVILNKSNIDKAYVTTYSYGSQTEVAFKIEFNREGKSIIGELKNPSTEERAEEENTETTEPETTENATEGTEENATEETEENATEETKEETSSATEKTYKMKINGEDSYSSTIDKMFVDNIISLSIGQATSDKEELKSYLAQAQNLIAFLSNEDMPLTYTRSTTNEVSIVGTDNAEVSTILSIIVICLAIFTFIILAIQYKKDGLLLAISNVGFAALLLLVVRYGNVTISIEGIVALFMGLLFNLTCIESILRNIKKDENKTPVKNIVNSTIKDITMKIIPLFIIAIAFTFTKRTPANSFGMVMFWGLTLVILYNITITKLLVKYGKQK